MSREAARRKHKPTLALSYAAWGKYFDGDPHIIGKYVPVAGQEAIVVGILPNDSWRLTDRPDAWLLESNSYLQVLPAGAMGFVIGHTSRSAQISDTHGHWQLSMPRDQDYDVLDCVPITDRRYQPWITFLFTLILACVALPATTPLPLGDYPATDHPLFAAMRWRRWRFLIVKIALLVLIVYCISTSLAFANSAISQDSSVYIQFCTSFIGLLFSFRWALRDQRRRCPVCLRILSNPARVGHPSQNFLAWHGTEFMCAKGHGLLHIPEMATSWFSTQRWLYLDQSWKGLFPESYMPSAGIF
jgi:hypothetical protein